MRADYREVVKKTWKAMTQQVNKWEVVQGKLKRCQQNLQRWVRKTAHSTDELIKQKTKELNEVQQTEGPTDVAVMRTLQNQLHVMMEQEDLK